VPAKPLAIGDLQIPARRQLANVGVIVGELEAARVADLEFLAVVRPAPLGRVSRRRGGSRSGCLQAPEAPEAQAVRVAPASPHQRPAPAARAASEPSVFRSRRPEAPREQAARGAKVVPAARRSRWRHLERNLFEARRRCCRRRRRRHRILAQPIGAEGDSADQHERDAAGEPRGTAAGVRRRSPEESPHTLQQRAAGGRHGDVTIRRGPERSASRSASAAAYAMRSPQRLTARSSQQFSRSTGCVATPTRQPDDRRARFRRASGAG
jgi:hypothetical protein